VYEKINKIKRSQVRSPGQANFKRLTLTYPGKVVSGWKVDSNSDWTLIGKKSPQVEQMFYPVADNSVEIKKGEVVAARCTMVTKHFFHQSVLVQMGPPHPLRVTSRTVSEGLEAHS
jgi:hypothetical protein